MEDANANVAEFRLPSNSRIQLGTTYAAPKGDTNTKRFSVYRCDPDNDQNPRLDTYDVNTSGCAPLVLDARATAEIKKMLPQRLHEKGGG